MHEYDIALKVLLQASAESLIKQLTGGLVMSRWLNAEMPQVQSSRADLLGSTMEGELFHFELQSTNDPDMPLRMVEYALRIYRVLRRFPKQIVLYLGDSPLRMTDSWTETAFAFRYTLIDMRDLDSAALLASPHIEDNVLAILTRLQDQISAVRQILKRIAMLDEPARRAAFAQFLIISGLRRLASVVKEEAQKMPVLNDILDHEVIGPAILQGRKEGLMEGRQEGRQEGRVEGRQEGRVEGRQEGRSEILKRVLEKRFGQIPDWVHPRLLTLSVTELDTLAVRIFDVTRIEELF